MYLSPFVGSEIMKKRPKWKKGGWLWELKLLNLGFDSPHSWYFMFEEEEKYAPDLVNLNLMTFGTKVIFPMYHQITPSNEKYKH